MLNFKRYKRVPVVDLPQRNWPNKEIEKAPIWCSVDLRDGNQALIEPMTVEEKVEMFNLLLKLGFKEIEIGFPAASQIEFDFLRKLVNENMIPDDVKVQVLTQCRENLIDRTFEAIEGIKNVVVHIYNSTSVLQRDVVFHADKETIKQLAIDGTKMVQKYAKDFPRGKARFCTLLISRPCSPRKCSPNPPPFRYIFQLSRCIFHSSERATRPSRQIS